MTTKRARVFRSSSNGELGLLLNQLKPIESPVIPSVKKRATAAPPPSFILPKPVHKPVGKVNSKVAPEVKVPEYPRRSIFTVGSSVGREKDERKVDEWRWEFPFSCFLCKKKIQENKDLFMYGYLRAFCSPKCRGIQIDLEERDRETSPAPPKHTQIAALQMKTRNPPPE
ncbi:hypothetical protein Vadar_009394 [Vaccinium darrowii]|uniref:Uncharacterized protein n=1 Tax=Vaccinium darrowii TaxID=229202 RepID=A0ACB7XPQ0_9ERIC|nr:hypothetical protein Vadar_009394 [Vaccinium darrowii]